MKTKIEITEKGMKLAVSTGHAFIATADINNWPHLALAKTMKGKDESHIAVNEWYCPGTMSNLQSNPHVAVIVWNAITDTGYQLVGEMEHMLDIDLIEG